MRPTVFLAVAWFSTMAGATFRCPEPEFQRGDVDSNGKVDLTDVVLSLKHFFGGQPGAVSACADALDADDDGRLNLSDPVHVLQHLFAGGPPLPGPVGRCGPDPTGDDLGCDAPVNCLNYLDHLALGSDGAVFVIDRSATMGDAGELDFAKRRVKQWLCLLDERHEIGIVFFDRSVRSFPDGGRPAPASEETKALGADFLDGAVLGGGACPLKGLLEALTMLEASQAARKTIVFLSDGGTTCTGNPDGDLVPGILRTVAARNMGRIVIHTVGVIDLGPAGEPFLRRLAAENGGEYHRISR